MGLQSYRPDHLSKEANHLYGVWLFLFPAPLTFSDNYLTSEFFCFLLTLHVKQVYVKQYILLFIINIQGFVMSEIDSLKEQIEESEAILVESRENYEKNPDQYSAKLLLMSIENHLADLLKQLDILKDQK